MSKLTLLDIAKLKGSRKEVGLIESVADAAPELAQFPARTIKGTSYPTVDRHKLSTTGFRTANTGIAPSKSEFKNRQVQCHIFSGAVNCDKAVADANEDGAASYQAMEAAGVMRSAALTIGTQTYYGKAEDDKGFDGLQALWEAHNDDSGIGHNATGTTADGATSVYAVKFGPEFLQFVYGGGQGLRLPPFKEQSVTDGNGGQYEAYVSNLGAWVGLQCVHPFAVGRIYNLTAQANKGLTDDVVADLLSKFPVGFTPDALLMNRQSRRQLQKSRTVVLQGNGKAGSVGSQSGAAAPIPTESQGVNIITTDSLVNNEKIVS